MCTGGFHTNDGLICVVCVFLVVRCLDVLGRSRAAVGIVDNFLFCKFLPKVTFYYLVVCTEAMKNCCPHLELCCQIVFENC